MDNQPNDDESIEVFEEADENLPPPVKRRSWLVTAAVGVLMLLVGLFLGYVGRGEYGPEAQSAKATASAQAVAAVTRSAANADMMKYLVDNTRHFKGQENAPVTIIEFSDFQ